MGGASSTEQNLPPWLDAEEGKSEYSVETVQKIQDLSKTARAFLTQHPYYEGKFAHKLEEEDATALATACMEADDRIAGWFPKLVPKRVHEDTFWNNYFSHVEYLIGVDTGQIPHAGHGSGVEGVPPKNKRPAMLRGEGVSTQAAGEAPRGIKEEQLLELTFTNRPFGIELVRHQEKTVFPLVHFADAKNIKRGLTPGHLLVKVNGQSVARQPIDRLLRYLKGAPLPMTLSFLMPTPSTPHPSVGGGVGRAFRNGVEGASSGMNNNGDAIQPSQSGTKAKRKGGQLARPSMGNEDADEKPSTPLPAPLPTKAKSPKTLSTNGVSSERSSRAGDKKMGPDGDDGYGKLRESSSGIPYWEAGDVYAVTLPKSPSLSSQRQGRDLIRLGLVGCGSIARGSIAPALASIQGARLESSVCRDRSAATSFAKAFGCKSAKNVAELIDDPNVNVVYIATPPGPRASLALMACKAIKPCILEAPIARSYIEARAVRDAFSAAGVPLYVSHPRRAYPRARVARRIVKVKRLIGEITGVSYKLTRADHIEGGHSFPIHGIAANKASPALATSGIGGMMEKGGAKHGTTLRNIRGWRGDVEVSGGGLFMEYGCHALDLIEYIVGPISRCFGDAMRAKGIPHESPETAVVMSFRAGRRVGGTGVVGEGGVPGMASFNFATGVSEDKLCVEGTNGRLEMSVFGDDPPVLITSNGARVFYPFPSPEVLHLPFLQRVMDSLHGCPMPEEAQHNAESAVRLAGAMDAALRTFYRARDDHFWKRSHTWL